MGAGKPGLTICLGQSRCRQMNMSTCEAKLVAQVGWESSGWMKSYFRMVALVAFGCAPAAFADDTARSPCNASLKGLDISMVLQNAQACFVSQKFAERLARLVMEEKYQNPNPIFVPGRSAIADGGDTWRVTFENTLRLLKNSMRPREITVEIRKTDGAIVALPAQVPKAGAP